MLFSVLFVFCAIFIFLSIFLIALASLVDSLPLYVSVIHLLGLFVSIFESAVILFYLDFCFLISLWTKTVGQFPLRSIVTGIIVIVLEYYVGLLVVKRFTFSPRLTLLCHITMILIKGLMASYCLCTSPAISVDLW